MRVKDRVLGLLRLFFMLAIFSYIVGYVLIYERKYLELEQPVGTASSSLLRNTSVAVGDLPYCTQSNAPYDGDKLDCLQWDEFQAVYPPDQLNSIMLTTTFAEGTQLYNETCDSTGVACNRLWYYETNSSIAYSPEKKYVAAIEEFQLGIRHSFQARNFFKDSGSSVYSGTNSDMHGVLKNKHGKVLDTYGGGLDVIRLSLLLEAAGVDFDAPSYSRYAKGETQRQSGLILLVYISISNKPLSTERPTYTYYVSA